MPEPTSHRLNELEQTIAFQQRTIDQLNEVVIQLHGRVDQLQKAQQTLQARQEWLSAHASTDDVPNERPPHY